MYQTISQNTEFEITEKKSKFIAHLIYIESKIDAEDKIKEFKKKYHDARHNCYAYRVQDGDNMYEKASDDGEPSGTAGAPMLNILQKSNLCNVIVIVTRYFGGILLGTGGLVRCYSGAAQGVIEKASRIEIERGTEFKIKVEYNNFKNLQHYAQKNKIKITNIEYGEDIICLMEMNNDIKKRFLEDVENKKINMKSVEELEEKNIKVE